MNPVLYFGIFSVVLLCYAGYAWSMAVFCRFHLGCSRGKEKLFAILFAAFFMAVVITGEILYIPYILYAMLQHVFTAGLVVLLFWSETEKKVFAAVALITIRELVGTFADSLLSCLALVVKDVVNEGQTVGVSIWGSYLIGSAALAVTVGVTCFLSGRLTTVFRNKMKKWYVVLAVPLVFIVIVLDVVNFGASHGIMVVSDANGADYWNVYYNQIFSHMAMCILTVLSMCAAGFYVFGMNRIYMEQQKKEQYRSQIAFYQMLEEQYGQMEKLRHDMKNHIIALRGLLEKREWEKMQSYLNQMMETGNLGAGEEVTGSRAVDALLYGKKKQAQRENIVWECNMHIPHGCRISEFDLCVLLVNLLDNAVEACERMEEDAQKFIRIRLVTVKRCLLLEVENSTSMKRMEETCVSRKEKPEEHGIGLMNIRESAEKYNGAVNVELEGGCFVCSVLLPLDDMEGVCLAK